MQHFYNPTDASLKCQTFEIKCQDASGENNKLTFRYFFRPTRRFDCQRIQICNNSDVS